MGCRAFFIEFLSEFEKEKDRTNWEKLWEKSNDWNAKMLGTGESREKGDYGLFGRLGKKFGYNIQAEWMRIDQIWFYFLPESEEWKDLIEWPWKTDVVIEHENTFMKFHYTLLKLGEVSAPLKVGIFYPSKEDERYALETASQVISKQVISYPGGVYLLLFGFLEDKKHVYWHAYEIDFKGNIIPLHQE